MKLFTGRRPAAEPVTAWQFASGPEVGDNAFEVRFTSPAAPDSAIYVTFYAATAAPRDSGYLIGYRYDLVWNGEWSHIGWGSVGSLRGDERPYSTPDDALGACWRLAVGYAEGGAPAPGELNGQVFIWDGQPWGTV